MINKFIKAGIIIFVFFVFWSLYNLIAVLDSGAGMDMLFNYFGITILFSVITVSVVFRPKKKPILKIADKELTTMAKEVLKNLLASIEKGSIVSRENISPRLIPIMQKEMDIYKEILSNGIEVECKAENIDHTSCRIVEEGEKNIKLKLIGVFRHNYYHNKKMLDNPADKNNYANSNIRPFQAGGYTLNFEKFASGDYRLIGYTDDIVGNKYGEL